MAKTAIFRSPPNYLPLHALCEGKKTRERELAWIESENTHRRAGLKFKKIAENILFLCSEAVESNPIKIAENLLLFVYSEVVESNPIKIAENLLLFVYSEVVESNLVKL